MYRRKHSTVSSTVQYVYSKFTREYKDKNFVSIQNVDSSRMVKDINHNTTKTRNVNLTIKDNLDCGYCEWG
jgi:hypothetical protein